MNKEANLSLEAYKEFIQNEKIAKPIHPVGGIFLGECVSFKTQEVVLFQKKNLQA